MIRIGIDVGGTNTDAVVVQGNKILSYTKQPTTSDVTTGIKNALKVVMECTDKDKIGAIMIGTTHFINAVLERKELDRVAVLRLCGPSTISLNPMVEWPSDLREQIFSYCVYLSGGVELDGSFISDFSEEQVRRACREAKAKGLNSFAVSCPFSPLRNSHELMAYDIIKSEIPNADVSLSHQIGRMGLIERENATIMNAALVSLAKKTINGFKNALLEFGLDTKLYLLQNDGTLMTTERAIKFPVMTFSSGPTNTMRGAAYLTKIKEAYVIDIGGTSSDVGFITKGFPRDTSVEAVIAGVRTNFRMPDVYSIGLGGGSIVNVDKESKKVSVGPTSVGFNLSTSALVFGGNVLTTTDIAVASGLVDIGDKSKVANLDDWIITAVRENIIQKINHAIDQFKLSLEPLPVILCGGGSILVTENDIKNASIVIKPEYYSVTNAIGAAIAQVFAEVNRIINLENMTRNEAINKIKEEAKELCVSCGAQESTIEVINVEDVPITYLPGNRLSIRVKVAGDLSDDNNPNTSVVEIQDHTTPIPDYMSKLKDVELIYASNVLLKTNDIRIKTVEDLVIKDDGWYLDSVDVEYITYGASLLGAGGGGNAYYGRLLSLLELQRGKTLRVIPPEALLEDDITLPVCFAGSPVAFFEKLCSGIECTNALASIEKYIGKKASSLIPIEMGGFNATAPLLLGAQTGIPVVDADGMGRAFPEIKMVLWYIYGVSCTPLSMCDEKGNQMIVEKVSDIKWLENLLRTNVVAMKGIVGCSLGGISKQDLLTKGVTYSISQCWHIGQTVYEARLLKKNVIKSICESLCGIEIFRGKITDVERRNTSGFAQGKILISDSDKTIQVDFLNENLLVSDKTTGEILATVPDIISILDSETGRTILTEELRFGFRVAVIILPCHPLWRTEKALRYAGPEYFGYDTKYKPVGDYVPPKSIMSFLNGKIIKSNK